jgi:plastocyanin
MNHPQHRRRAGAILLSMVALISFADAQTVEVTAHVQVNQRAHHGSQRDSSDVVLWLTPADKTLLPPREQHSYTLEQKNKEFLPHILVVATGSTVDFPNLDPFFHNVFSLFNGKRFDLGLYEAHTHRVVQFDREGVSYIFCNIHPEMGAVVIALSTPYFGMSTHDGVIQIRGVPPGSYRLNLWAENVPVDRLIGLSRMVEIGPQSTDLGNFQLPASGDIMTHHENKFGEAYTPAPTNPY